MDTNIKPLKAVTSAFLVSSIAYLLTFLKVSYLFGSYAAFFSGKNMVLPLSGLYGGLLGATAAPLLSYVIRYGICGILPFKILAYHVPGYCASLYLATNSMLVRLLLPALCIVLFIVHPVGCYAAPYTVFWFIPMGVYMRSIKGHFAQMLGSTFTAHAVGSVIWLYCVPMSVASWYALIPVVCVERLLFATGMWVAYQLVEKVSAFNWRSLSIILRLYSVTTR